MGGDFGKRPRRPHVVKIRLHANEYDRLKAKAAEASMTVAELLRDRGDQIRIVNRTDWRLRTFQLSRIGSNVNQLARWANRHKSAIDAHKVVIALLRLETAIRAAFCVDQRPEAEGPSP